MVRRGEGIGGKLGNFFGQREKRDQVFRSGGWRQLGIAKGMRCGAAVHVRGLLGDGGGGEQVQEEKKEDHHVLLARLGDDGEWNKCTWRIGLGL